MSRYRLGVELKLGLDVRGDGFVGISVGLGFGWNNKHVRVPKKDNIPHSI